MRYAFVFAFCSVVALGCGSSGPGSDEGGSLDVVIPVDGNVTDDAADVPGNDIPGTDIPVSDTALDVPVDAASLTREIKMQIDTTTVHQVAIDQEFTFRAQILEKGTGTPVPNPAVSFNITYCEDTTKGEEVLEYDGVVLRPSAIGDAQGKVSSTFRAGKNANLEYTITVSTNGAESKTFKILVLELDCSCSKVSLTYEGVPGDGASYRVMAFDSSVTCDSLAAGEEMPAAVAEVTHGSIEEPALIPCLTPDKTYTVLVIASETCEFARGCAEGVTVGPAKDAENCGSGTVALSGAEINIGASFSGKHKFTLTNVFPTCTSGSLSGCDNVSGLNTGAQACCYINLVTDLFSLPGADVADAIVSAGSYSGSTATSLDTNVRQWILSNTPAWVTKATTMGPMLRNLVIQTNVESIININTPNESREFTGNEDFRRFVLYWKMDCDPSDPNYYACGKMELAMQAIGSIDYSPNMGKANFEGALGVANNFAIDSHTIGLNPGRLLVYAVNKIASVTLTGGYINASNELITVGAASDLKGAFARWINCQAMTDAIYSQISGLDSKENLKAACDSAVDTLMAKVVAAETALKVESRLELSGTGSYTDTSCDNVADELGAGVYSGNYVRGSESVSISGTFSGIDQ